jgi:hypothetical protein
LITGFSNVRRFLQMRAMIIAYREDNADVEFKFVHVFAWIETCDKWKEVRLP